MKSSKVVTDSDVQYFIDNKGNEEIEPNMSNHFYYKEYIQAGYLNLRSQPSKKWKLQAGLRVEQTNANGQQITLGTSFNRDYINIFPSAFAQYKASDDHQFGLSYSKRIDRPNYQDLNPARSFYNRYAFWVGNPNLQPQYTNSFEFKYTLKSRYRFTLSYSRTADIISNIVVQEEETGFTYLQKENIGLNRNIAASFSVPIEITQWWQSYNFINAYQTIYSEAPSPELNQTFRALMVSTNHSFKLPYKFKAEFSGWLKTGHVWGVVRSKPSYVFSAGVQRAILNGNAILKLAVKDLFNTYRFSASQQFANSEIDLHYYRREGRVFTLSLSYNFGKNTVQSARNRKTGIDQEEKRLKGGSEL